MSSINKRVQLAVKFGSSLVPCRTFEFAINGEAVPIHTLSRANVGYHHRPFEYTFNLGIYQLGDATPQQVITRFNNREYFTIQLVEHDDSLGVWTLGALQWNDAVITQVRGTGMTQEDIPMINISARALEVIHTEETGTPVTYGHQL